MRFAAGHVAGVATITRALQAFRCEVLRSEHELTGEITTLMRDVCTAGTPVG